MNSLVIEDMTFSGRHPGNIFNDFICRWRSCLLTAESHEQSVKIHVLRDFRTQNALIFTIYKTFFFIKGSTEIYYFWCHEFYCPTWMSELTELKCKAIKSEKCE